MEKQMTVQEVLQVTIENLSNIQIPVAMVDSVGVVIAGSIKNIRMCIDAIEPIQKNAEPNQEETEAPEVKEDGRETDPE